MHFTARKSPKLFVIMCLCKAECAINSAAAEQFYAFYAWWFHLNLVIMSAEPIH
jgi:hypothetical protein